MKKFHGTVEDGWWQLSVRWGWGQCVGGAGGSVREGDRMHIYLSRSGASFLLETQEEDNDDKEEEEERLWFGAKMQHLSDSVTPGLREPLASWCGESRGWEAVSAASPSTLMLISFSCHYVKDQRLPLCSS